MVGRFIWVKERLGSIPSFPMVTYKKLTRYLIKVLWKQVQHNTDTNKDTRLLDIEKVTLHFYVLSRLSLLV